MSPDDPHETGRHADEEAPAPRLVRPYTITAGRTRTTVDLPLEATLRVERQPADGAVSAAALPLLALCDTKSVAEVSALARLPIGVVRVLLGDLVEQGCVSVQATITESSSRDERIELIERTLRGLRTY